MPFPFFLFSDRVKEPFQRVVEEGNVGQEQWSFMAGGSSGSLNRFRK
jgi:hypothetical protein